MAKDYKEPYLTIAVLDFQKPQETRLLLDSLRARIKFDHKIIYLHNGLGAEYGYEYFKMGLIDQFIQTRENNGLGIGTRDVMAASFSEYTMYVQNDQLLGRDFTLADFDHFKDFFWELDFENKQIASISLAGAPGGSGVYSERAHLIPTFFYKEMEKTIPLPPGGAGPYHHTIWREEAIQKFYKEKNYTHFTKLPPYFLDRGMYTLRDMPCGGQIRMRTDTKSVRWIKLPKAPYVFPEMNEQEWADSITGKWVDGTIPQAYLDKKQSFNCWGQIES